MPFILKKFGRNENPQPLKSELILDVPRLRLIERRAQPKRVLNAINERRDGANDDVGRRGVRSVRVWMCRGNLSCRVNEATERALLLRSEAVKTARRLVHDTHTQLNIPRQYFRFLLPNVVRKRLVEPIDQLIKFSHIGAILELPK